MSVVVARRPSTSLLDLGSQDGGDVQLAVVATAWRHDLGAVEGGAETPPANRGRSERHRRVRRDVPRVPEDPTLARDVEEVALEPRDAALRIRAGVRGEHDGGA